MDRVLPLKLWDNDCALLEIPPIQISGKNFVTSVYGWKTNVSNAKCYTKVFPPDVKGLNFDVYSNYLLKSLFL